MVQIESIPIPLAIQRVANNREPGMGKVGPNLMPRALGNETPHQGRVCLVIMRNRCHISPAPFIRFTPFEHPRQLPVVSIQRVHQRRVTVKTPMDQCKVILSQGAAVLAGVIMVNS